MAASLEIQVVGEAIQTVIEAIPIKTYLWLPNHMSKVPCAVIQLPDVLRSGPLERESQLGSDDWDLSFPIIIYNDLRVAQTAQKEVAELVEALIKAVDADPSLGGTVEDAAIARAEPQYLQEEARALIAYECTLECLRLVF